MTRHEAEHSSRRRFFSLGFLFVLGLFIVAGFGFLRETLRNTALKSQIEAVEAENERLQGEKLATMTLIDELSSEAWLEGEARRQGLARPGETLVILPEENLDAAAADEVSAAIVLPNPTKWFLYFFDPVGYAEITNQ